MTFLKHYFPCGIWAMLNGGIWAMISVALAKVRDLQMLLFWLYMSLTYADIP